MRGCETTTSKLRLEQKRNMQVLSALTKEMVLIAVVNSGCRSRYLPGLASFPVRCPNEILGGIKLLAVQDLGPPCWLYLVRLRRLLVEDCCS